MTVLFAGGEQDAFDVSSGTTFTDTADTSRRDTNFARASLRGRGQSALLQVDFTAQTEGWLHMNINLRSNGASQQDFSFIELIDSATGNVVLQVDGDNGTFNLEYRNSGGTFTEISPNLLLVAGSTLPLDIHWKIDNAVGIFAAYINGSIVASFEGDTLHPGFTQIDRVTLSGTSNFATSVYDAFYSEVIIATVNTIGWRLSTLAPDGTGNSTTWTGDNLDVDDAALDDANFISSTIADEVEQFTVSDLSATAADLNVEAVVVAARSRNAGGVPLNVQMSVRTGSSDFFGSNIAGIGATFTEGLEIFEQNPDTVADWTPGEVDALEIGVKSIT